MFLKWKTFHTHVASSLSNILGENSLSDVTLVSDDQISFQAHKSVLSAWSPVIKNLLLNNPHSHPLIYLRGVMHEELHSLLQFMYLGAVQLNQDCRKIFLDIAKDLK